VSDPSSYHALLIWQVCSELIMTCPNRLLDLSDRIPYGGVGCSSIKVTAEPSCHCNGNA